MEKIKGLWISDLVVPTGFSRVSHSIIHELDQNKYEIYGLGINYRGDPHSYTFPIFPAVLGGDLYGMGRLKSLLENIKPDFIFILNDIWVINQYLEKLKSFKDDIKLPKIIVYFPVDSLEHDISWYNNFDIVTKAVTYTEFGKGVVNKVSPKIDIKTIRHGVDLTTFFPIYENKRQSKELLFGSDRSDLLDTFIVLNANRNQPRKRLDITMMGFAEFAKDKNMEVRLYMHCGVRDSSIDIIKQAVRCGIDNKLIISNTKVGVQTETDAKLNAIYNACDVGVNTCYTRGTKVLTTDGYKPIEEVKTGDVVFSHTGIPSKVTQTFIHNNRSNLVKITPWGAFPFTLTGNHELYSDQRQYTHLLRNYKDAIRNTPNLKFIPANALLEGSVLTYPVVKEKTNNMIPEELFVYGAYLAEGSTSKSGIRFSLNSSKDELLRENIIKYMKDLFNIDGHIFNYSRNRQTIEFYSMELKTRFETLFGVGAKNKRIPGFFLTIDKDSKISLLKAYFLGDGHISNKSKTLTFTTVSESLAWAIWSLITTLGNIAPSISKKSRGEWTILVSGQSAKNLAEFFSLKMNSSTKQQRDKIWADENYIYYPIKSIEYLNTNEDVYDLEVEGEHSYVTHVSGHNSMGEGWGLTSVEHAVTGAVQIVPNHSACRELFEDCGILVPILTNYTFDNTMTVGKLISPNDVAIALQKVYENKELRNRLSKKALLKFSQPEYSWAHVAKLWDNLFTEALGK